MLQNTKGKMGKQLKRRPKRDSQASLSFEELHTIRPLIM
jgi:hypothetical protein